MEDYRGSCPVCGKPVYGRIGKEYCSPKCYKGAWRKRNPVEPEEKVGEKLILCKCPKCGVLHKKWKFYTGRAAYPPYFCENCYKQQYPPQRTCVQEA
jgi:hypothetical protein